MSETRLWAIRHAPVINPKRLVYGQADMPADLGDTARFQSLAAQLPEGAVWVTSHLSRTGETAKKLIGSRGWSLAPDPPAPHEALAEQHFGDWELIPWQELQGDEIVTFWTDFARFSPPGGESFSAVIARVGACIDTLLTRHAGRDIIIVAHGGTIRAMLAHALALRPDAALAFHIDTLSLTRLEYIDGVSRPGWRVTGVNLA